MKKTNKKISSHKQKIMNSAQKLFLKKGFSGVGVREIAAAAGVSLGNLYNHFKNKEEIFDALIEKNSPVEEITKLIHFLEEKNFPENIGEIIRAIKKIVDENMVFVRLADIDGVEFKGRKTAKILGETISKLTPVLQNIHKRHLETGKVRSIDIKIGLPLIVIIIFAVFVLGNRFGDYIKIGIGDGKDEERIIAVLSDLILHGIAEQ